ncbi:carbamoyltransferase [Sphaerisporangium melleum]|uniref:Carbamoyltransferase n=1 Tax=Sphaerisporangium melleum TaxID=321316 RepID=A0A917RAD7_9ACTN|nr:carbamoyltransferase C-terminal domain-containing protein [Sphaerisporangium melleum]GGK97243.1 carbamoyltransferase [Sphaerisporangium melleum]GII71095.1 carbamoyltransferase [Sphaerisporangium melleum]
MWVLGLNAPPMGWHDVAACLVDGDGVVHAMVEQERAGRAKHGLREHPARAAQACLDIAGITPADVDVVAVGWDMPRHATRTDFALDPPVPGRAWRFGDSRDLLTNGLGWRVDALRHPEVVFVQHHLAHACASFYASGHAEAAVLVVDGNGDDESISIYDARHGRMLVRRERWPLPHSLGYMYDAVSTILGMTFLEAGKTMGLAAYGKARGVEPWPIFDVRAGGFDPPFDLPPYALHRQVIDAWWAHFARLGFRPPRGGSFGLDAEPDAVRLAWSAQASLQEVMALLARRARDLTGHDALCLSGGVALNCSANGLLPPPVYVPPVPHDAGVSLGAAWAVVPPPRPRAPLSPYLGRRLPAREIDRALGRHGLAAVDATPGGIARRLLEGRIGAVVTGRAEVGPRALCHRSIIAAATDEHMRDRVNSAKGREPWRPLGPVGLPESEGRHWEASTLHRYMVGASLMTDLGAKEVPAAVHVDGTARPQVINREDGVMWDVLERFKAEGAPPVAINTSFNQRGEPIVDDAEGALRSARAIGLDFVVLEDRLADLRDR